jgi:hypothetical protein
MQHERAAVMALTFCIGFITAFIAYGIPTSNVPLAVVPAASQPASVVVAERAVRAAPTPQAPQTGVALDSEGLWLVRNGERMLVSPTAATAPDLPEAHTEVHQAVVSDDGNYLFFCPETATNPGLCEPRVFDVENYSVHRVQSQGQTGNLNPATLDVSWLPNGSLEINGFASASASQPWVVE